MKIGRLSVWLHFGGRGPVCGFWWFGNESGTATRGLILVPPWSPPLFSERYGSRPPLWRFRGWRVFGPYKAKEEHASGAVAQPSEAERVAPSNSSPRTLP